MIRIIIITIALLSADQALACIGKECLTHKDRDLLLCVEDGICPKDTKKEDRKQKSKSKVKTICGI